ncbi:hypothetical protein BMS3Abin02_00751 [bacterium BMS3Abin02]|nr:hypothetical protein BMS3Abin02_00751 [bacterium BMS3Abin02]HDL49846.1 hypothetical protein [Actinomycetota bacterium]
MLDQALLSRRLTGLAVRVAALEREIAAMGQAAGAWWSGPAAERFQAELRHRRAVLAGVRGDLHAAAALILTP